MSGEMATDHVNGNGTEEPMDTTAAANRSEHFPALLEAGLPQNVAEKLDGLYVAGKHTCAPSACGRGRLPVARPRSKRLLGGKRRV